MIFHRRRTDKAFLLHLEKMKSARSEIRFIAHSSRQLTLREGEVTGGAIVATAAGRSSNTARRCDRLISGDQVLAAPRKPAGRREPSGLSKPHRMAERPDKRLGDSPESG